MKYSANAFENISEGFKSGLIQVTVLVALTTVLMTSVSAMMVETGAEAKIQFGEYNLSSGTHELENTGGEVKQFYIVEGSAATKIQEAGPSSNYEGCSNATSLENATLDENVCLKNGEYNQSITINTSGVTLKAEKEHEAVINASGNETALRIEASNVTVEGLKIVGGEDTNTGIKVDTSEINESENITVAHNKIQGIKSTPEVERLVSIADSIDQDPNATEFLSVVRQLKESGPENVASEVPFQRSFGGLNYGILVEGQDSVENLEIKDNEIEEIGREKVEDPKFNGVSVKEAINSTFHSETGTSLNVSSYVDEFSLSVGIGVAVENPSRETVIGNNRIENIRGGVKTDEDIISNTESKIEELCEENDVDCSSIWESATEEADDRNLTERIRDNLNLKASAEVLKDVQNGDFRVGSSAIVLGTGAETSQEPLNVEIERNVLEGSDYGIALAKFRGMNISENNFDVHVDVAEASTFLEDVSGEFNVTENWYSGSAKAYGEVSASEKPIKNFTLDSNESRTIKLPEESTIKSAKMIQSSNATLDLKKNVIEGEFDASGFERAQLDILVKDVEDFSNSNISAELNQTEGCTEFNMFNMSNSSRLYRCKANASEITDFEVNFSEFQVGNFTLSLEAGPSLKPAETNSSSSGKVKLEKASVIVKTEGRVKASFFNLSNTEIPQPEGENLGAVSVTAPENTSGKIIFQHSKDPEAGEFHVYFWNHSTGNWTDSPVENISVTSENVIAEVTHFSTYSAYFNRTGPESDQTQENETESNEQETEETSGGGGAAAFPTPTEDEIIPTAEAGANRTVEIGEEILFNGSSSSNAVNFSWSFGDGETSEGEVVTHSYSEAGEYTVNLTVTSETGNIDSDQAYVTVEQPEEDEENPVDGTEEAQEESTQEPEENQGLTGQFTASGTNIAVAGIILALLTLAYMEYTGKTRVTSKTREIISQILEIR